MYTGTISTNVTSSQLKSGINVLLKAMLGSDLLVEEWWTRPNRYWGGEIPENCDLKEVYYYVLGFYDK